MWSEVCTQCEAKNSKQSSLSCNHCRNSSHQSVQSAQRTSWVEVEWYGRIFWEYFQNELQTIFVFTIWWISCGIMKTLVVHYRFIFFYIYIYIFQCLPNCISLCIWYWNSNSIYNVCYFTSLPFSMEPAKTQMESNLHFQYLTQKPVNQC